MAAGAALVAEGTVTGAACADGAAVLADSAPPAVLSKDPAAAAPAAAAAAPAAAAAAAGASAAAFAPANGGAAVVAAAEGRAAAAAVASPPAAAPGNCSAAAAAEAVATTAPAAARRSGLHEAAALDSDASAAAPRAAAAATGSEDKAAPVAPPAEETAPSATGGKEEKEAGLSAAAGEAIGTDREGDAEEAAAGYQYVTERCGERMRIPRLPPFVKYNSSSIPSVLPAAVRGVYAAFCAAHGEAPMLPDWLLPFSAAADDSAEAVDHAQRQHGQQRQQEHLQLLLLWRAHLLLQRLQQNGQRRSSASASFSFPWSSPAVSAAAAVTAAAAGVEKGEGSRQPPQWAAAEKSSSLDMDLEEQQPQVTQQEQQEIQPGQQEQQQHVPAAMAPQFPDGENKLFPPEKQLRKELGDVLQQLVALNSSSSFVGGVLRQVVMWLQQEVSQRVKTEGSATAAADEAEAPAAQQQQPAAAPAAAGACASASGVATFESTAAAARGRTQIAAAAGQGEERRGSRGEHGEAAARGRSAQQQQQWPSKEQQQQPLRKQQRVASRTCCSSSTAGAAEVNPLLLQEEQQDAERSGDTSSSNSSNSSSSNDMVNSSHISVKCDVAAAAVEGCHREQGAEQLAAGVQQQGRPQHQPQHCHELQKEQQGREQHETEQHETEQQETEGGEEEEKAREQHERKGQQQNRRRRRRGQHDSQTRQQNAAHVLRACQKQEDLCPWIAACGTCCCSLSLVPSSAVTQTNSSDDQPSDAAAAAAADSPVAPLAALSVPPVAPGAPPAASLPAVDPAAACFSAAATGAGAAAAAAAPAAAVSSPLPPFPAARLPSAATGAVCSPGRAVSAPAGAASAPRKSEEHCEATAAAGETAAVAEDSLQPRPCGRSHDLLAFLRTRPPDIPALPCPFFHRFGICPFGSRCRCAAAHLDQHGYNVRRSDGQRCSAADVVALQQQLQQREELNACITPTLVRQLLRKTQHGRQRQQQQQQPLEPYEPREPHRQQQQEQSVQQQHVEPEGRQQRQEGRAQKEEEEEKAEQQVAQRRRQQSLQREEEEQQQQQFVRKKREEEPEQKDGEQHWASGEKEKQQGGGTVLVDGGGDGRGVAGAQGAPYEGASCGQTRHAQREGNVWSQQQREAAAAATRRRFAAFFNRKEATNDGERAQEDDNEEGRRKYAGRLILAPLTTVGNLPFRRLCVEMGAEVTVSEMAVAQSLLDGKASELALLKRHRTEKFFGVQLAGGRPDVMAACMELLRGEEGVAQCDFVDINAACPLEQLHRRFRAGAALLDRPAGLAEIVRAMTQRCPSVPVTVKLRTANQSRKPHVHNILPRLQRAGAAAVILHPRTAQQRYAKPAEWDYLRLCRSSLGDAAAPDALPLIGCGDVFSAAEYFHRLGEGETVQAVMIGRGALVKPWIFTEIKEHRVWDISASERLDLLKRFVSFGLEHWGSDSRGVATTRRFLLELLSFQHRYVPPPFMEYLPQLLQQRPSPFAARSLLEQQLSSPLVADWVDISAMLLGPPPKDFVFVPKHVSNSYAPHPLQFYRSHSSTSSSTYLPHSLPCASPLFSASLPASSEVASFPPPRQHPLPFASSSSFLFAPLPSPASTPAAAGAALSSSCSSSSLAAPSVAATDDTNSRGAARQAMKSSSSSCVQTFVAFSNLLRAQRLGEPLPLPQKSS